MKKFEQSLTDFLITLPPGGGLRLHPEESLFFVVAEKTKMSCLFRSLGTLLDVDPGFLRQKICDYLATNPSLMEGISAADAVREEEGDSPTSLGQYVDRMRRETTWGGAIEIRALCDMTGHVISVAVAPGQVISFSPSQPPRHPRRVLRLCWTGNHYEVAAAVAAAAY
jgi:hypothetical protein